MRALDARAIGLAVVAAALFAGCGGGGGSSAPTVPGHFGPTPTPTPTPAPTSTPQQAACPSAPQPCHIVIIMEENRSFDNMFAGYPGADAPMQGLDHNNKVVPLQPWPLEGSGNLGHERPNFTTEYNNGNMNGFDLEEVIGNNPQTFPYSYVPRSESAIYWTLAQNYTLADHMFQSNSSSSFAAHQFIISAQSADVVGAPDLPPWGCDAPPGTTTTIGVAPPATPAPGPFPCFPWDKPSYNTLADLLDAAKDSWRYYTPSNIEGGDLWSAYDAVRHIRCETPSCKSPTAEWLTNVVSPETTILQDIPAGRLASVSWVVPSWPNSDHPDSLSNTGPDWVASIVNAVGQSKYWNSTAIFIMWDDWGGWYDDVPPPQLDDVGLGFRTPFLVVSPYAKHNYVSHVQYEYGSVVKFAESTFGLPSLYALDSRATDARANALSDCFDFTQQPQPFKTLAAKHTRSFFLTQPPSRHPPDEN
jgi:phospholipase C